MDNSTGPVSGWAVEGADSEETMTIGRQAESIVLAITSKTRVRFLGVICTFSLAWFDFGMTPLFAVKFPYKTKTIPAYSVCRGNGFWGK
jgi:hypothetical protein